MKGLLFMVALFAGANGWCQTAEQLLNDEGVKLLEKERYKEAFPIFDSLVSIDPSETPYRHNRAVALFNLKRYKEALRDYLILHEENPEIPDYAFQTGNSYEHLDSVSQAIAFYSQAIALEDGMHIYYFKRGTLLLKEKAYRRAIEDFNKSLELFAGHDNSLHNRGLAFYFSGNSKKACEDWCEAALLGNKTSREHLKKHCTNTPIRCKQK